MFQYMQREWGNEFGRVSIPTRLCHAHTVSINVINPQLSQDSSLHTTIHPRRIPALGIDRERAVLAQYGILFQEAFFIFYYPINTIPFLLDMSIT